MPPTSDHRHATPSDAALLREARAGDAAAFAAVYARHAAAAHALAQRMLSTRAAADDVVQESFLALWRTDAYRPEQGSLRAFLLQIVRNRAIDVLRADRRRQLDRVGDEALAARLPAADRVDDAVERRETRRLVRAAVAGLPAAQHDAVRLAYFAGLTHSEIASRLQEPIGTVKGRIRLGLRKLRTEIDAAGC